MDVNIVKVFSLLSTVLHVLTSAQDPTVTTRLGKIIGRQKSVNVDSVNQNISVYLGIPYAKLSVKGLRFQKPEPIMEMETPFEAKQYGKFCPQAIRLMQDGTEINGTSLVQNSTQYSEDCLFLNIFVPDIAADRSDGHAVMIWVHGGGFIEGASDESDSTALAAYGNVIVVTINYRIGVFGFLSTGDSNAPGNYGLWDQHLAFKWVHENIASFGGDALRVTIAGESAGAMSVIQQALFPQNRELLQRVISQSGTPTVSLMDISRDVLKDAQHVGQSLGCKVIGSTEGLVDCLRNKTVDEIYDSVNEGKIDIGRFTPSIDGDFIKTNPYNITEVLKRRDVTEIEFFRSLDFLNGFNANEGAIILYLILKGNVENFMPSRHDLVSKLIPVALQLMYKEKVSEELVKLVTFQYMDWKILEDPSLVRLQFLKLLGDALYGAPAVELTRVHENSSVPAQTYMYYLTPKPGKQMWFAPSWTPGATHGDDLPLLFLTEDSLTDSDPNRLWEIKLSRKLITYWTNFIKTGNPNSPVQIAPNWPEFTLADEYYLELEKNMTDSSARQYLLAGETSFWGEVLPDLMQAFRDKNGGPKQCDVTSGVQEQFLHVQCIVLLASLLIIKFVS